MTQAAKTVSARPAATAPDAGRLKLQAFSSGAGRANWELRSLGAPGFALASARG
jgi:hypothetical protein